jgi:hypothetical protein
MHSLQQRVHSVGARARRLVLLHGASLAIAVVVAAALAAGVADYLIRYRDQGVRIIVSLLFVAAGAWSVRRFVLPAWRYRPSDIETARRIERRFPQLRDRLSSSVAFLNEAEDDPRAGSAELRRVVISETEGRVEHVNLEEAIDPRLARKAMLAAAAMAVVAAAGVAFDPASAGLAARRLAMPWSSESWPLWNNLAFENPPRRLAKGANFEVELIDTNSRLPDEVQIQYWHEGDDPSEVDVQPMKLLGDRMLARRENVARSFRYRAVGGDHQSMPWTRLEVVEPPQVAELEILLHPPEYTGWPIQPSDLNIRALERTRVEIHGAAEKPLRSARIAVDADEEYEIPLTLAADQRSFHLTVAGPTPWRIISSGAWRLLLTDETGVTGGSDARHELQAIPDRPPNISLEGDDAVSYVTPRAMIPLRGVVKDDLAIHTIELRYLNSAHSDQDHQSIEVYRGPDKAAGPLRAPSADGARSVPAALEGQTQRIDYTWDLAQLEGLAAGVQLAYHVAASDYKPQEDKSASRRLVIISERELEDRIGRRHSEILARLAEALDKQRGVRSQTTSLEIQLDEAGALTLRDLDHLQSAELNQRQVQRMLAGAPDAVEQQIAGLLEDVKNNRLDNPEIQRRMNDLLAEVQRLGQEHLPAVQSGLIEAIKAAQAAQQRETTSDADEPKEKQAPEAKATQTSSTDGARTGLNQAGEHQDAVIAGLEQMLGELSQWDNYRRVARDLHQLRREQDDLAGRTNEQRLQTLGKEEKDLSPQERAALRRLAQQQGEIGRRFEQAQGRMRELAGELASSDPLAAETLADALDAAQRAGLSSKLRESTRNLEANRLGQAAQQQKETAAGLEDLLNVLSNRREHELGRLVEKLRDAAAELQQKQKLFKELRKKMEDAASQQDPAEKKRQLERLSPEHQKLAEEIDRLSRRLQRLRAERASQSASQSAESLSQAGQQSQEGAADQALENFDQAEHDLEEAQQELQQAIAQAEQDLFFEQMARLEQAIAGMIKRQQAVVEEIARLEKLQQQGELTRGQRASVASLAVVERALAEEAEQFAVIIAKAKAFEFALRGAIREMNLTAARLDRGETGAPAQQPARAALDRLERLAEALQSDPGEKQAQQDQSGQESDQQQMQQPPGDGIAALAELKLLKLMQEELNDRTAALEEVRTAQAELSPKTSSN